jgi:restriction endonuclease S subunit
MRDGWVDTVLGELAEISTGSRAKGGAITSGIPSIGGEQIAEDRSIKFNKMKFIPADHFESMRTGKLKFGDSLLVKDGATTGKVGYWDYNIPAAVNEHVFILRAKPDCAEPYFINLLISHRPFREEIESRTRGIIGGITRDIENIELVVPPLPEQKRIVDLVSSVDSYIEALQQQLESAKKSRNAVLHELLTAGGDDWETTTIGDISDFVSVRKSPEQLSADSIYVGLEHLEPNNTSIDNFDSVSKVTSSLTPFDVGDVLFGRLRPYLHKVAIAEMFGFCSPEILVLRANPKVLPQMLLLFCDADSTIKICVERSAGTRMPRTSTEDLASIEIRLPPIVEQIKLAELSSTFDTDISHLGIALEKSKILRSGLLSDLLSGTHEIPASYDKVIGAA